MKIFMVGGAVRDLVLGSTPKDRDYVVVGARPEELLRQGFLQVGADFPVFLHPETNDEYALARTEKKAGMGYQGFLVNTENVTLEEDLSRRDLTINAMAMATDGSIIDPFGGQQDLRAKTLRHTTEAFREDPLRLLRVARFLARFGANWQVAPETWALLEDIVTAGELDTLTPERIWKEIEKGLNEPFPGLMLDTLQALKVFDRPAFQDYTGVAHGHRAALALAAKHNAPLAVRFALAFPRHWDRAQIKDCRVPVLIREVTHGLATALCFEDTALPDERVTRLQILDALRQESRFELVLTALAYLKPTLAAQLKTDAVRLKSLDYGSLVAGLKEGRIIQDTIRAARISALSS